jgi:hypothetical protein
MAHATPEGHAEHSPPIHSEYDALPVLRLTVWLVVITLVTVGTIVGVIAYFNVNVMKEQQVKEGERATSAVREARSRESEALTKGGPAGDIKAGATREPIARTMSRIAANPALLEPVIVAAPPPPPAPASAPAPKAPGAATPNAPAPSPTPVPGGSK